MICCLKDRWVRFINQLTYLLYLGQKGRERKHEYEKDNWFFLFLFKVEKRGQIPTNEYEKDDWFFSFSFQSGKRVNRWLPKTSDRECMTCKQNNTVPFYAQINWLNHYNQMTLDTMEPLLTTELAKAWLRERTKPYTRNTSTQSSPAAQPVIAMATLIMATVVTLLL